MASDSGRKSGGNFRLRKQNVEEISVKDLENPWNFYALFSADDSTVLEWLRNNGLLARTVACERVDGGEICTGSMSLKSRKERKGGEILRCNRNRNHVKSLRANSFFERTKLELQDVMVFIKSYLDKSSLYQCAKFSGMAYGTTAVNWASYMRELFKEYFHRNIRHKVIHGTVEIDESLFGRRVKYHRGNPNKGLKIWIFGLVDRDQNTVILYPVGDRTKETLLPIIQRHVAPGSTIYSDGWSAYFDLNSLGYRHFTVLHKYAFKKNYRNVETGAVISVHTNKIEGAWKHAKDHFRRIVGTKSGQFEGHLAEIMWRSHTKGDLYQRFGALLKDVFPLYTPAEYHYTTPLFDSWSGPPQEDTDNEEEVDRIVPVESGVDTSESEAEDPIPAILLSSSSDDEGNRTLTPSAALGMHEEPSTSVAVVRRGPNIKTTKRKQSATDNVCHPPGFVQTKKEGSTSRKRQRPSNPYKKSAFVWNFESDDDDFM